ncbi:MAG: hypothetical protein FJ404_15470 [Verrucomicrobia bacterium]|nr:hypothetical protein [Verrucomicrobiota bacterium]
MPRWVPSSAARLLAILACCYTTLSRGHASEPPSAAWFPTNTLIWTLLAPPATWQAAQTQTSLGALWSDPAMRPFREDSLKRLHADFLSPLETQSGLRLSNLWSAVTGPSLFALTAIQKAGSKSTATAWIGLLEGVELAREFTNALSRLEASGSKPARGSIGKNPSYAFERVLTDSEDKPARQELVHVVSAPPFLLLGESREGLEEILKRKESPVAGALPSLPEFRLAAPDVLNNGLASVWFNGPWAVKLLKEELREQNPSGLLGSAGQRFIGALGFDVLRAVSLKLQSFSNRLSAEWTAWVPSTQRTGLFRVLTPDPWDAAIPAFVPSQAHHATRLRLDGAKVGSELERVLSSVSPEMSSVLKLVLDTLGKDLNPPVDFRRQVLERLGNDWTVYRSEPVAAINSMTRDAVSVVVLGAEHPKNMMAGVRALFSIAPNAGDDKALRQIELEGHDVLRYQPISFASNLDDKPPQPVFFAALTNAFVIAQGEAAMIHHLRNRQTNAPGLAALPGAIQALEFAGGSAGGLASIHQLHLELREPWETARLSPRRDQDPASSASAGETDILSSMGLDTSLLPPFNAIARHFYFSATAGASLPEGLRWRWVWLNPPAAARP